MGFTAIRVPSEISILLAKAKLISLSRGKPITNQEIINTGVISQCKRIINGKNR